MILSTRNQLPHLKLDFKSLVVVLVVEIYGSPVNKLLGIHNVIPSLLAD